MIDKIEIYPQPDKCCKKYEYQDKPNYAEEARQSAIDAANASVLAMKYAERAEEAAAATSEAYTKTETDDLLTGKADRNNVYTKAETNTLLENKADRNNVYTKTQIDQKFNNVKSVQSAVVSPNPSGNSISFIDTVSQNEQGVITVTKKTVRSATDTLSGLMTSTDKAKLNGIPEEVYSKNEIALLLDTLSNTFTFKPGDSMTFNNLIQFAGVWVSNTHTRFTIPCGKTITADNFSLSGGFYIRSDGHTTALINISDVTVTLYRNYTNIVVDIVFSAAVPNAVAYNPIIVQPNNLTLSFS